MPKYKDYPVETNPHDKQIVESHIKRLNDRLQKDPQLVKKAALVIEQWLNTKPGKR